MPGLSDLLRNPRRLRQFADTPGNYSAALDYASQASPARVGRRPASRTSTAKTPGTLETGDVIEQISLPDGSLVKPATESGKLVKVPGKSNLYLDPATGEPYQPDPTKPTGLRSAYETARQVKRDGKVYQTIAGIGERELGPDPKAAEDAAKAAAKIDAENRRLALDREKRPYQVNRITGEPIPRQTDEEWAAIKQAKAAKLDEAARVKRLKDQADLLELDAADIRETAPKPAKEDEEAFTAAESALSQFADGQDMEEAAAKYAAAPATDEASQQAKAAAENYLAYKDKVKPAKEAEKKVQELEARARDIKRQIIDPKGWKAGKAAEITTLADDDLVAEVKAQADIINEQEEQAVGTLDFITKGRNKIVEEINAFQEERRLQSEQGLNAEEIEALNLQQARLEQSLADYDDHNAEAKAESDAALKAAADRRDVLAVAGTELEGRAAKQAEAAVQAKAKAETMAKAKPLYEQWAKDLYAEDWRNESFPRLEQEAKKAGLDVEQAKEALQTYRQLDWSNARRDSKTAKPIAEESRTLPDGNVTVNPTMWGDAEAYKKAVEASQGTPEGKAKALESFPKLQELHAEKAVEILSQSANIPGADNFMAWRERKIAEDQAQQGKLGFARQSPAKQAIAYMDEMKNRSWFRKAGEQVAMGLLAGFQDIATQALGVGGIVTGSETLADLAAANAGNTQSVVGAQSLEGSDTDYALRVMGMGARMTPPVAAMISGAGAVGGGLGTAAVLAGGQTAGSMFADLYRTAKEDAGLSHGEAWKKAALPAALAGTITGLLTKGMGATGLERVFSDAATQETARNTFKAMLGQFVKGAAEELPEEIADEYFTTVLQESAASADPVATFKNFANTLPELAGVTALMGGAGALMQARRQAGQEGPGMAPPPEGEAPAMPVQPRPAGPAPTPAPETPQDVVEQIAKFNPTGATPLPQSVSATAKRTGRPPAAVARQAAAGVVKIAQGQSLESLDIEEQEALGFVNKGGKITPDGKVTPLVYLYKDKPVLRNAAAEWLTDEAQEGLADMVKLTEAERKAQIDAEEAAAKAKPAVSPAKKARPSEIEDWDWTEKGKVRRRATDEWFEEGMANEDVNAAFERAHSAGGENLATHGMAKYGTLSGAFDALMGLLLNNVDPTRGKRGSVEPGGLDVAPLTVGKGSAAAMAGTTGGGTSYRDGPFILVQSAAESKKGKGIKDMASVSAILVNDANAGQLEAIRREVHKLRPDIIVDLYSKADVVAQQLNRPAKKKAGQAQAAKPESTPQVSPEVKASGSFPENAGSTPAPATTSAETEPPKSSQTITGSNAEMAAEMPVPDVAPATTGEASMEQPPAPPQEAPAKPASADYNALTSEEEAMQSDTRNWEDLTEDEYNAQQRGKNKLKRAATTQKNKTFLQGEGVDMAGLPINDHITGVTRHEDGSFEVRIEHHSKDGLVPELVRVRKGDSILNPGRLSFVNGVGTVVTYPEPAPAASQPEPAEPALTPKQADQMARAQAEYDSAIRLANADPEPEIREKKKKAAGMRFSAAKRIITGKLTAKEAENKAKREASNYEGKAVSVDGKNAEVIGNAFGKVKVKFADGTKAAVPAAKVKPPVEAGPEAAPAEEVRANYTIKTDGDNIFIGSDHPAFNKVQIGQSYKDTPANRTKLQKVADTNNSINFWPPGMAAYRKPAPTKKEPAPDQEADSNASTGGQSDEGSIPSVAQHVATSLPQEPAQASQKEASPAPSPAPASQEAGPEAKQPTALDHPAIKPHMQPKHQARVQALEAQGVQVVTVETEEDAAKVLGVPLKRKGNRGVTAMVNGKPVVIFIAKNFAGKKDGGAVITEELHHAAALVVLQQNPELLNEALAEVGGLNGGTAIYSKWDSLTPLGKLIEAAAAYASGKWNPDRSSPVKRLVDAIMDAISKAFGLDSAQAKTATAKAIRSLADSADALLDSQPTKKKAAKQPPTSPEVTEGDDVEPQTAVAPWRKEAAPQEPAPAPAEASPPAPAAKPPEQMTPEEWRNNHFDENEDRGLPADYFADHQFNETRQNKTQVASVNGIDFLTDQYGSVHAFDGEKNVGYGDGKAFVVEPAYQRRGIGTEIIAIAKKESPTKRIGSQTAAGQALVTSYHKRILAKAAKANSPVNAAAVDAYGIALPTGYVREGDLYVYRPEASPAPASKPTAQPPRPATPEGRAEAALAEYEATVRQSLVGKPAQAAKDQAGRKLDLAKRLRARLKAMTGAVDYDVYKPELSAEKGELAIELLPGKRSSILFVNPAKLIDRLAKEYPNTNEARAQMDKWFLHEFVHLGALAKLPASKIERLYNALTPEAKDASRKLYFKNEKTQFQDDFQAAHEWFAQQYEAILRGDITSSGDIKGLTDPTFRESMMELLRDFIAQLRDIAAILQNKNPAMAAEIRAAIASVQPLVADMAAKAGLEIQPKAETPPTVSEQFKAVEPMATAMMEQPKGAKADATKQSFEEWAAEFGVTDLAENPTLTEKLRATYNQKRAKAGLELGRAEGGQAEAKPASPADVIRQHLDKLHASQPEAARPAPPVTAEPSPAAVPKDAQIPALTEAQERILAQLPKAEAAEALKKGLGYDRPQTTTHRLPNDPWVYMDRQGEKRLGYIDQDGKPHMLTVEETAAKRQEIERFESDQKQRLDKRMDALREEARIRDEERLYQITPSGPAYYKKGGKWYERGSDRQLGRKKEDGLALQTLEGPNVGLYEVKVVSEGGTMYYQNLRQPSPAAATTYENQKPVKSQGRSNAESTPTPDLARAGGEPQREPATLQSDGPAAQAEPAQPDADMEAFIAEQQAIAEEEAAAREALRNDPDAIDAVQASGKMSGRNLSKQFEYPEARAVYQALTAARDMLGGPETVQLDKLREWAKKTFESDPEKYVQWAADMAEDNKLLDVDEQAVLGQAFQFLTREARLTGDKNTRALLNKVGNYYLDTGTRLAQAMSARRDPLETPQERWTKALDIVFGPSEAVRRKLRILPTEAGKARRIASLEAQLAEVQGSRRADIEAALKTARAQETQEELLEKDDAESQKIKERVLKNIGVTEDDLMLSGTDRVALQSAILDLPAVKAGLEAYKGKDNDGYNIMRLAFRGFSDEHIANYLNLNQDDVGQFIHDATNAIIRPAVAEQVKAGTGFGGLVKAGFARLKKAVGLGLPPRLAGQGALDKEYMQAVEAGDMERAQAMVDEAAKAAGYLPHGDFRDSHVAPSNQLGTDEDVRNGDADASLVQVARGVHNQPYDYFDPRVGPRYYSYQDKAGMEAFKALRAAMDKIQRGKKAFVTVYRAVPIDIKGTKLENRDWVTPSKTYAVDHGESRFGEDEYRIIKESVPAESLFWDGNDIREWGKDDAQNYFYKNTANNIKSADPVTRDKSGQVIPLSERFNPQSNSILRLPPKAIEAQPALIKGTRQTVADVTAEVNRVMKYALQSAKARNSGKLMSKVVMTPGGQRVRVFVPFDPDDIANYYAFAREYTAAKAGKFDKLYEYWINWPLLSGPQTQVANITGNAAQVAWHYTGQRFTEAFFNLFYQDPNAPQYREFKHILKGFWQGIGPAFEMARQTFLTEGDTIRHKYLGEPMQIDMVDGDLDKIGNIRASVGGKLGRINRLPGRVLRFTDAFFKTAIMYAEASAVAYRRAHVDAKAQGLKGKARANFIDTEIANTLNDPSSAVWGEVMKTAEELLFQDENVATEIVDTVLGGYRGIRDLEKLLAEAEAKGDSELAAKLQKRIRSRKAVGSLMRWIFPFQRTPTNIIRAGIKKAGGSAISLLYGLTMAGWRKHKDGTDFIKSYPKAMQIKDASETLLAGLGWLALASMLEGDDDDDKKKYLFVGTRSHSLKERAATDQFLRKYGGENSLVRQDGNGKVLWSVPFGRYEPAATMLTTWIDAYRNYQEVKRLKSQGENASYSTYMLSSFVSSLEDKSFLQGFSNAMQFIRDVEEKRENPDENAGVKTLMNNVIPNLIKQLLRNMDDVLRERTTAGPGYAALPNPTVAPKLPAFAAQPKINTTGERMPKAFTPPVRLLFQANTKVTPQPDALLYRANRLHPTKRWSPQPLQRDDYTADPPGKAKPVPITDPAKKRQFAELAGRLYAAKVAQVAAKAMPSEKDVPGESLIKAFKKAREDAMAAARAQAHAMGLHKATVTP